MNKTILSCLSVFILLLLFAGQAVAASAIDTAYKDYAGAEGLTFDIERGKKLWDKAGITKDNKVRKCSTCHGDDLSKMGKHAKTGKVIKPLAPSANKKRFTKLKKINKWFKRNCKWTLGRECTGQEKGDLLMYLSQL